MSAADPAPNLCLARDELTTLPPLPAAPPEYDLRHFRAGEEMAWVRLADACFETETHGPELFYNRFGDWEFRPERMWFATYRDRPVATATAWYRVQWGFNTGMLHWVATFADHRGHGLGYLVSLAALHQMVREGRDSAVLETQDHRVPAIRVYLRLGFRPRLVHETHRARWAQVLDAAQQDPATYARWLEGPLEPPTF